MKERWLAEVKFQERSRPWRTHGNHAGSTVPRRSSNSTTLWWAFVALIQSCILPCQGDCEILNRNAASAEAEIIPLKSQASCCLLWNKFSLLSSLCSSARAAAMRTCRPRSHLQNTQNGLEVSSHSLSFLLFWKSSNLVRVSQVLEISCMSRSVSGCALQTSN